MTVEILFCLMSSLENCLISTYIYLFSTRIQMEKNWGDTPSATLTTCSCKFPYMYNMNLDTIMILQWFSKTACQASPKYNNHIKLIHIVLRPYNML